MSTENDFAESPEQRDADAIESPESLPVVTDSAEPELNVRDADSIIPAFKEDSWLERKSKLSPFDFIPQDETFPWESLPDVIRGAVLEICKNDKLAVPIAVQAVLSAVSLACQDLIWVDRGIGEKSVCSLYMLSVADSGSRKSRADSAVTPSIELYNSEMESVYEERRRSYEHEVKRRDRERKALEKASDKLLQKIYTASTSGKPKADEIAKNAEEELHKVERRLKEIDLEPFEFSEPRFRKALYSKISIRSLERSLADNWSSAGLFSDEAAGILNARGESDMSSLDQLWEGKAIDVVGRTSKESFSVKDPRLTISLMVQPVVFDRFLERKGDLAKGIGFMSRVLLARPDTPYGRRKIDRNEVRRTQWIDVFNERVRDLLRHAHSDKMERETGRSILYFESGARRIWEDDFNEKEAETTDHGKFVHEREFVNRYSEHVARLAALFHYFEYADLGVLNEKIAAKHSIDLAIPRATVEAAIRVATWYLNEFSRVFNPDVAMKEMAAHVLQKLEERLKDKNRLASLDEVPINPADIEYPANQLRVYCTKYGLKKNVARYKEVLSWLEDRENITVEPRAIGSSNKSTDMVCIKYDMDHSAKDRGLSARKCFFRFKVRDRSEALPRPSFGPLSPRTIHINPRAEKKD